MTDYEFSTLILEYLEDLAKLGISEGEFAHLVRAFLKIALFKEAKA